MICREVAWASNRFVRFRCMKFTVLKGIRQNGSGAKRIGIFFYFVVAGAVAGLEEGGGGRGHGSMPLPWGPGRGTFFLPRTGHSKRAPPPPPPPPPPPRDGSMPLPWGTSRGTFFCFERAIPKGTILVSKGPFWCQDCFCSRGQFD